MTPNPTITAWWQFTRRALAWFTVQLGRNWKLANSTPSRESRLCNQREVVDAITELGLGTVPLPSPPGRHWLCCLRARQYTNIRSSLLSHPGWPDVLSGLGAVSASAPTGAPILLLHHRREACMAAWTCGRCVSGRLSALQSDIGSFSSPALRPGPCRWFK